MTIPISSIEERRTSDVSLMPEGLAQTMTDQELINLLAYLTTLKQPVSIVGQYQAIGPVHEPDGRTVFEPIAKLDLRGPVSDGQGRELSWRRVSANAEGQADLSPLWPATRSMRPTCGYRSSRRSLRRPGWSSIRRPRSPSGSAASRSDSRVKTDKKNEPRAAVVDLPEGSSTLLIRVRQVASPRTGGAGDDDRRGPAGGI